MAETKPTLQHLDNSQSQFILWLLEELGIDYDINFFEREKSGPNKHRAPAALKETHPLGKSPQLIISDKRVIIERLAISKYLIEKYDTTGQFKLNPDDPENDAIREEELLAFGAASLSPILMVITVFKYLRDGSPFFVRPLMGAIGSTVNKAFLSKEAESMMKYLDEALKGKEYMLNTKNPTRVDFCTLWYMDLGLTAGGIDLELYPNVKKWCSTCKARPAWNRALEKGNGYGMKMEM